MIDLHCHVLAGIDDGPPTIEDSVAIATAAAAAGTRTLVATSHVSWEYPNRAAGLSRLRGELALRLRRDGVPIEIVAGAEIAITHVADLSPQELSRLTLGAGRWLLIEPPFTLASAGIDTVIASLQGRGYGVVLAHPERCIALARDRPMLERLVASGVLTSVTAGSLVGRFGRDVRRFALELVEAGLAHNVASDAHDPVHRPPTIAHELEQAGLASLSTWLTQEVPWAILSGRDIPPRPALEPSPPGGPDSPTWSATTARRRRWLPRKG
jgi:protein-tyrosine phosphatase